MIEDKKPKFVSQLGLLRKPLKWGTLQGQRLLLKRPFMKTDTLNKKKKKQCTAYVADSLPHPLLVNVKPGISSQYFVYL